MSAQGVLRAAESADRDAVRRLLTAAFPTPAEADLVEALRAGGDAEIDLVCDVDGRIAGHILLSRMRAEGDGRPLRALGLAPVAVLPERQRRGIGGRLIREALAEAQEKGTDIVFLLGDPAYYGRFGFSAATAAPFASPYAGPYFQAIALADGFTLPNSGRADYAEPFAAMGAE